MADVASDKRFGLKDIGLIILRAETEESEGPTSLYTQEFPLLPWQLSTPLRSQISLKCFQWELT